MYIHALPLADAYTSHGHLSNGRRTKMPERGSKINYIFFETTLILFLETKYLKI